MTLKIFGLLARLGATVRTESALIGYDTTPVLVVDQIGSSPLLQGIQHLGFKAASLVVPGAGQATVGYQGNILMAIEPRQRGWLVVAGDAQFIDDTGLTSFVTAGNDNMLLADHLAHLR
jgi:hypothetical protein